MKENVVSVKHLWTRLSIKLTRTWYLWSSKASTLFIVRCATRKYSIKFMIWLLTYCVMETHSDVLCHVGIHSWALAPHAWLFKDYIANPKSNGYPYNGLWTKRPIEIQIRTKEMHRCRIRLQLTGRIRKDHGQIRKSPLWEWTGLKILLNFKIPQMVMLRGFRLLSKEISSQSVFMFFTPNGAVQELPKRFRTIDFRHAIHTQVGEKMGAKVNGRMVPSTAKLKTGDGLRLALMPILLVLMSNWIKMVKQSKARNKILIILKNQIRRKRRTKNEPRLCA